MRAMPPRPDGETRHLLVHRSGGCQPPNFVECRIEPIAHEDSDEAGALAPLDLGRVEHDALLAAWYVNGDWHEALAVVRAVGDLKQQVIHWRIRVGEFPGYLRLLTKFGSSLGSDDLDARRLRTLEGAKGTCAFGIGDAQGDDFAIGRDGHHDLEEAWQLAFALFLAGIVTHKGVELDVDDVLVFVDHLDRELTLLFA